MADKTGNDYIRAYWMTLLTDFAVGIQVAVDEGEKVPDSITKFMMNHQDLILDNNAEPYLNTKFAFHKGELEGKVTGYPAWNGKVNRRRTPKTDLFHSFMAKAD